MRRASESSSDGTKSTRRMRPPRPRGRPAGRRPPGSAEQVRPLIREGVCAFKAFLCHSGIDEFPNVTEADLRKVMPILAEAGLPLFVHAELVSPLPPGVEEHFAANPRSYQAYLATRPPEWEAAAIRLMIDLCREYRCPVHIVH